MKRFEELLTTLEMSGEELRRCCIYNEVDSLKEYLLLRSNPCSTDEYGLSPLHYAIWNGNIDCAKYLIMNPNGITKEKERKSCINLQSTMGYTPLHLLALECPLHAIRDILFSLLLNGADPKLKDFNNQNAIQLAKDTKNEIFIESFHEFIQYQKTSKEQLKHYQQQLKKKYRLLTHVMTAGGPVLTSTLSSNNKEEIDDYDQHSKLSFVDDNDTNDGRNSPIRELPLEIQNMIVTADRQTKIIKPKELIVHEDLLPKLTQTSFIELNGLESMRSLNFVKQEAIKNLQRREKLVQLSDQTLPQINVRDLSSIVDNNSTKKKSPSKR